MDSAIAQNKSTISPTKNSLSHSSFDLQSKKLLFLIPIIIGLGLLFASCLGAIGLLAHNVPQWLANMGKGGWPYWTMLIGGGILGLGSIIYGVYGLCKKQVMTEQTDKNASTAFKESPASSNKMQMLLQQLKASKEKCPDLVIEDVGRAIAELNNSNQKQKDIEVIIEILGLLINQGADINQSLFNDKNWTLFCIAWKFEQTEIILFLLKQQGFTLPSDNKYLSHAINMGWEEIATMLVEKGVDVKAEDESALSFLNIAVQKGHFAIVKALIKHGVQPNIESWKLAAREGHIEILKYFFETIQDINQIDIQVLIDVLSPMIVASKISALMQSLNEVVKHKDYSTILYVLLCKAASLGEAEIIEELFAKGAQIEVHWADAPIHCAAQYGKLKALKKLYEHNADIEIRTKNDRKSALHLAIRYGHKPIFEELASYGANINTQDADGSTPLHTAIEQLILNKSNTFGALIYKNCIIALLDNGANIDIKDKKGRVALDIWNRGLQDLYPEIRERLIVHSHETQEKKPITSCNSPRIFNLVDHQEVPNFEGSTPFSKALPVVGSMDSSYNLTLDPILLAVKVPIKNIPKHVIEKANMNNQSACSCYCIVYDDTLLADVEDDKERHLFLHPFLFKEIKKQELGAQIGIFEGSGVGASSHLSQAIPLNSLKTTYIKMQDDQQIPVASYATFALKDSSAVSCFYAAAKSSQNILFFAVMIHGLHSSHGKNFLKAMECGDLNSALDSLAQSNFPHIDSIQTLCNTK